MKAHGRRQTKKRPSAGAWRGGASALRLSAEEDRMVSVFIRGHQGCHHRPMSDAEVRIRRYDPSDREAAVLLAIRLEIGVAHWRDADAVRRAVNGWIEASLAYADAVDRAVFVAHIGGEIAGLVTVAERIHFTGDVDAYVGELVVQATHERRGVGTLLMDAAEEWGRRRGLRHLTLETGAANLAARAFYTRCGYREEDVRLTKSLDRPSPPATMTYEPREAGSKRWPDSPAAGAEQPARARRRVAFLRGLRRGLI